MDEREKLKRSQLENLKHMNIFEQTADLNLLFQHSHHWQVHKSAQSHVCLVNEIYMHLAL